MKPVQYAQTFTVPHSTAPLYRKRALVPEWLWRLVASPDIPTLVRVQMQTIRGKYHLSDDFYGKGVAELLSKPDAEPEL